MRPYEFLDNTLAVLHVDNEVDLLACTTEYFKNIPIFNCKTVVDITLAADILSKTPINLCILDILIPGYLPDPTLIKRFKASTNFIVYSGFQDLRTGGKYIKAGAKDIISKPEPLAQHSEELFSTSLLNFISPDGLHNAKPALERAVSVLMEESPENIPQWAAIASVSESYLRKLWTENYKIQPHFPLFLYHSLKKAFRFQLQHQPPDEKESERDRLYFLSHRKEMDWIINRRFGTRKDGLNLSSSLDLTGELPPSVK